MENKIERMMSRILEIRYSDIEEEKCLCLKVLEQAKNEEDTYAQAFAYTYLGDHYVAREEMQEAMTYLKKARSLIVPGRKWEELKARDQSFAKHQFAGRLE